MRVGGCRGGIWLACYNGGGLAFADLKGLRARRKKGDLAANGEGFVKAAVGAFWGDVMSHPLCRKRF